MNKQPIQRFSLSDIPDFQRLQQANPQNPNLDALSAILMYGRAIHWASIFDIIWPDFEKLDHYQMDVAYIIQTEGAEEETLPESFYKYVAQMIAMFWELQLQQKYPNGDWIVEIDDEPELTIDFAIHSRW
jgi:hypothetical protein